VTNEWHLFAFTLAAIALLGSPGPGIAALVAVGRIRGVAGGLKFYGALQLGLATAAAASAAGLASAMSAVPVLRTLLTIAATAYLLWLAWSIAMGPVDGEAIGEGSDGGLTLRGGFLFGVANPKAYVAFASLMGSFTLAGTRLANAFTQWLICVLVMLTVDLAWLWLGALIGSIRLSARAERMMNVLLALTIVAACATAFMTGNDALNLPRTHRS